MTKRIALFGATGRTGQKFIKAALKEGYEVNALARDVSKLKLSNAKLTVFEGDILDQDCVNSVVENTDIVISLFGHVKGSPEWLQTDGTKNIVGVMRTNNVDRIISLSGGGLPFPQEDKPKFADKLIRIIMKIAVPKILNDAIKHAQVLEKSDLKWTIVRAPRLTDDQGTGKYRIGWVGVNSTTKISRTDLASFILTLVEKEKFICQMPMVSA